ncbi:MAG: hypothetical protein LC100_16750 [Chitinophagales bacterium]|nr:hypothetical protein [Chitinophagales bacterium]
MKFKVGDKVRIRPDLNYIHSSGNLVVVEDMIESRGEVDTIAVVTLDYNGRAEYRLEGHRLIWNDNMLIPASEPVKVMDRADELIKKEFNVAWIDKIALPTATETKEMVERVRQEIFKFTNAFPKEEKKLKFTFYVKEGTRPDKKCNGLIPTMTTTVVDASGKKATVTCDKVDYSERQGVLEAIAQMACGGNFDKEYDKAVKKNKLIELHDRTCTYCGKVFDTVEELKAHEAWHVERKKARRERYLLRKRAKEIAFEEQAQKMAKEMMGEQK